LSRTTTVPLFRQLTKGQATFLLARAILHHGRKNKIAVLHVAKKVLPLLDVLWRKGSRVTTMEEKTKLVCLSLADLLPGIVLKTYIESDEDALVLHAVAPLHLHYHRLVYQIDQEGLRVHGDWL